MKHMHTIHYGATPGDLADIWQMVQQGWRHRAYILRWPRRSCYQLEVAVYRKSKP